MSDSAFQDWLVSDSWQDYKQQRAIREIESSLDGQRAESRALRSQLSRLQGSLEQRLSRLIRSFDAFVELSDLRAELAGFDEAARTRYRMRQILAFRAGAIPALPAAPEDVDGYWLAPAAAALAALTRGDDASADLELAAARDSRRTALLLVMSGAAARSRPAPSAAAVGAPSAEPDSGSGIAAFLAAAERDSGSGAAVSPSAEPETGSGMSGFASSVEPDSGSGVAGDPRWVGAAFGELLADTQLTAAERAIWVVAADGHLGQAALELVAARLSALVNGLGEERRAELDRAISERIRAAPMIGLTTNSDLAAMGALTAGTRLAALRDWATTTPEAKAEEDSRPALEALLPGLVDEGSDEEAATLRRIAELRAVIDDREITPAARWDNPAGPPLGLLVADAFGDSPPRRALARRVLRDRLLAVGETLRAATEVPDPQEQTVTIDRQTVRVRAGGPAPADLDALHKAIDSRYPQPPSKAWQRYAWFAGAAALLLAALAVPLGFAVVLVIGALILAFVGVRRIFADRLETNEHQERLRGARERADKQIELERQSLAELGRRLAETRRQAPEDLTALRTALAA